MQGNGQMPYALGSSSGKSSFGGFPFYDQKRNFIYLDSTASIENNVMLIIQVD
jgi:hypothetical protein